MSEQPWGSDGSYRVPRRSLNIEPVTGGNPAVRKRPTLTPVDESPAPAVTSPAAPSPVPAVATPPSRRVRMPASSEYEEQPRTQPATPDSVSPGGLLPVKVTPNRAPARPAPQRSAVGEVAAAVDAAVVDNESSGNIVGSGKGEDSGIGDREGRATESGRGPNKTVAPKKAGSAPKRPSGSKLKNTQEALAQSHDWDEDNPALESDEDSEAQYAFSAKGVRITARDLDMIRFLARFRYAQSAQLARYVGSSKKAIEQRLTRLGKARLIRREDLTRGQGLWTPTAWGLSTADLEFSVIGAGKISPVTVAHTLGLVNIGVELEAGRSNMLDLPDWGEVMRAGTDGQPVPGETLITEREIRSAMAYARTTMNRVDQERALMRALEDWRNSGNSGDESPELLPGNEGMLVLWSTRGNRGDHVPDLVVARPRNSDGTPASHAIELELTAKPDKEWERILTTYAQDRSVYASVHYFTHKKTIANRVSAIAHSMGLGDRFFIHRYVPANGGLPFFG